MKVPCQRVRCSCGCIGFQSFFGRNSSSVRNAAATCVVEARSTAAAAVAAAAVAAAAAVLSAAASAWRLARAAPALHASCSCPASSNRSIYPDASPCRCASAAVVPYLPGCRAGSPSARAAGAGSGSGVSAASCAPGIACISPASLLSPKTGMATSSAAGSRAGSPTCTGPAGAKTTTVLGSASAASAAECPAQVMGARPSKFPWQEHGLGDRGAKELGPKSAAHIRRGPSAGSG